MQRLDTPKGRHYITEYGTFPSVTTVLGATKPESAKQALEAWQDRTKNHDQILKEAGERGTYLHERVDRYLNASPLPPFSKREKELLVPKYWKSIISVVRRVRHPVHTETAVCHPDQGYAGTLDCIARDGKDSPRLILWDWKTALKYKRREWIEDYFCQAAAYAVAARLVLPGNPQVSEVRVVIALTDRPAIVHPLNRREITTYYNRFLERLDKFRHLGDDWTPTRNAATVKFFKIKRRLSSSVAH